MYSITLVDENNKLALYYLKASHNLLSNVNELTEDKENYIFRLWKKQYKSDLDFKNKAIHFSNEKDKTLFLLRWS